jgi:hypothetical protein
VAVPDGDVAWLHRVFRLRPKVVPHTVTVTGSNGLFRRSVFEEIAFDPSKRYGEDVALNYEMDRRGFASTTVEGLTVTHNEHKGLGETLRWLYLSGRGASRQLLKHRQIRMPDMAFFGFVASVIVSTGAAAAGFVGWAALPAVPATYLLLSAFLHMRSKFRIAARPRSMPLALLANSMLLFAYYAGRLTGVFRLRAG